MKNLKFILKMTTLMGVLFLAACGNVEVDTPKSGDMNEEMENGNNGSMSNEDMMEDEELMEEEMNSEDEMGTEETNDEM